MRYQKIPIVVDYQKAGLCAVTQQSNGRTDFSPSLTAYLLDDVYNAVDQPKVRPAVIVCPGGGYWNNCFDREGEPIALAFSAIGGCQTFVLDYSVAPMRFPGALLEIATAVALIRDHANEWNIDPQKIFVCGFSAAGHLVSSLGVHWNRDFIKETLGLLAEEHRPNGVIACYPVISSDPSIGHEGSFVNLLGENPSAEQLELASCEKQVNSDTPPFFIWHTREDQVVPVENSLCLAQALAKQGTPFELHIYPHGQHGQALATEVTACDAIPTFPECSQWVRDAVRWMNNPMANNLS